MPIFGIVAANGLITRVANTGLIRSIRALFSTSTAKLSTVGTNLSSENTLVGTSDFTDVEIIPSDYNTFGTDIYLASGEGGKVYKATPTTAWEKVDVDFNSSDNVKVGYVYKDFGGGDIVAQFFAGSKATNTKSSTDLISWTTIGINRSYYGDVALDALANSGVDDNTQISQITQAFDGVLITGDEGLALTTPLENYSGEFFNNLSTDETSKLFFDNTEFRNTYKFQKFEGKEVAKSNNTISTLDTIKSNISSINVVWITQNSNFGATNINSIAYANNLWVAAGYEGQIRTSTNAITWVTQNSNFGVSNINSIAFGNNLWTAVGRIGQLRTSTDAITWVTQTSNFGATTIISIAFANNLWVAGGYQGQIRTSTNAINWVTQTSNFLNAIYWNVRTISYGNGLWVASAGTQFFAGPQLRTSTNAITWVTQNSNFGTTQINSIAFANNLWVAGGNAGQLRTSTNAITWVTQASNFENTAIRSIAYGDNLWVAAGYSGQLRTSTNAITWVTQNSNFGTTNIRSIAYDNNLWVAGGSIGQLRTSKHISTNGINPTVSDLSNNLFSSTDGFVYEWDGVGVDQLFVNTPDQFTAVSKSLKDNSIILKGTNGVYWSDGVKGLAWATQTSNFGNTTIRSIAYGNSLWVAGGYAGQLRTSTNAITWITQNSNFGNTSIFSIAYGDNLWVAGGYGGQLRTSTNAINWVTLTSNFGGTPILSIAYGDNLWVAGGHTGQLRTSTNAITWVTRTSNFGITFILSIAFGNGLWVASGNNRELRTSTNAITWVTQNSNFVFVIGNSGITSIAYGNNLWVAGGDGGQIRTSTNAITWVTRTSNFGNTTIRSIAFDNNLWVAGGNSGQIRTSTNAITWITQNSNFGNTIIRSIAYGDNLWVAGGYTGQLRTSPDVNYSWTTLSLPISSNDITDFDHY